MTISHEPLGRFRSDLVVETMHKEGAGKAVRILDPISQVSHVMTELEYVVASCMDGHRTADQVAREAAKRGHPVQADHVERFHRELDGMSFVYRDALEPIPPPDHRGDAARFIEEARREVQLGRMDVARDLIAAALEVDHATALGTLEKRAFEPSQTSPTVDLPLPLEAIEISLDMTSTVPRSVERRPPRWLLPALVVTACAAGAQAASEVLPRSSLSAHVATVERAPSSAPSPSAPRPSAPPRDMGALDTTSAASTAVAASTASTAASTTSEAVHGVIEKAERSALADVVAPFAGRFVRNPMKPGVPVKKGQPIGVVIVGDKRISIAAKAAGPLEFKVATGATVKRGDLVAIVQDGVGAWRATARIAKLDLPWDCSVLVGDGAPQPCEVSAVSADGAGARVVAVMTGAAYDVEDGKLVITPRR